MSTKRKPLIYIAGPYSAPTPEQVLKNVEKAIEIGNDFAERDNCHVFIPHLSHYWDQAKPHDYEFWMDQCLASLKRCDAMFVIDESPGVNREIEFCRKNGIPVFFSYTKIERWLEIVANDSILAEAAALVAGDRNKAYGNPEDNFANIADAWNAVFRWGCTAVDVGLAMLLLKVVRHKHCPKRDNLVDSAGYAACLSRMLP